MKVYTWLLTLFFLFNLLSITPITAQSPNTKVKASKQKRARKKASRQAAESANQWQGGSSAEASPENSSPNNSEELFGETETSSTPNSIISSPEAPLDTNSVDKAVYTLEEQKKLHMIELKQARKKLDKKSPDFARDLARIDLQERYWQAEDIREPLADGKLVFSFQSSQGPKLITYDENGEWLCTISLLNHNQVPVGVRKLAKKLEMEVNQFENKFCLEMRELRRPVYALYTSQKDLVTDTIFLDQSGMPNENLVVGVNVFGHGQHFTYGRQIQSMSPDDLGFLAMVITADGFAVPERDILKLLEGELFLFPQQFQSSSISWTPPVGWSAGKDWFVKPNWEPEYNRWYPTPDWYVDTDW